MVCRLLFRCGDYFYSLYYSIMTHFTPEEFINGKVLLIDKEIGWTSFDVVNKLRVSIRNYLGIKKIKVGHTGTLDPLAS